MRKFLLLFLVLLTGLHALGQQKVRITLTNGWTRDIPVENIQDMSFVQTNDTDFSLVGEWVFADKSQNLCTAINFHEDGLLQEYVFFDSPPLPESFIVAGAYQYRDGFLLMKLAIDPTVGKYTVSRTSDTEFTLGSLGTTLSNDLYYKVVNEIGLQTNGDTIAVGNSENEILYVDDFYVGVKDNRIYGKKVGTGYIIVQDKTTNKKMAYKINVERGDVYPTRFEDYLRKTAEDITSEFGDSQKKENGDSYSLTYYNTDSEVQTLLFNIDKTTNLVSAVNVMFDDYECLDAYLKDIKSRYILDEEKSDELNYYFYDTEDILERKISISVNTKNNIITYGALHI